jgi:hypothetical protein
VNEEDTGMREGPIGSRRRFGTTRASRAGSTGDSDEDRGDRAIDREERGEGVTIMGTDGSSAVISWSHWA